MSKFCQECGKQMNDTDKFCKACGVPSENVTDVVTKNTSTGNKGKIGLILGIISIIAWFIPLIGFLVTTCGIIFSAKGMKEPQNKSDAIVGLVLSMIFLMGSIYISSAVIASFS